VDAGDREEINLHLKFTIVNSLKIFLFFSAIFGLLFYSCGKDCTDDTNPECPNYDPCKGKTPTNANFKTMVYCGDTLVEVDFAMNHVAMWYFVAEDSTADEYLWEIGSETYTTRIVNLKGFPNEVHIPIKLTVKRNKPNTKCFPDDKGIATLTKSIYSHVWTDFVYNYSKQTTPINTTLKTVNGTFHGYKKSNPNDYFDVTIKCYEIEPLRHDSIKTILNNSLGGLMLIIDDVINIPYKGRSSLKTFLTPNGIIPEFSTELQRKYFGKHNSYQAAFNAWTCYHQYANESPFAKYYSYFMYKAILHPTDKDKITIIYEFFNPETQKRESDVFYGTRL